MLKKLEALKPRNIYLNRLIAFQDTEPVKVITGIHRCGKSSLLKQSRVSAAICHENPINGQLDAF